MNNVHCMNYINFLSLRNIKEKIKLLVAYRVVTLNLYQYSVRYNRGSLTKNTSNEPQFGQHFIFWHLHVSTISINFFFLLY